MSLQAGEEIDLGVDLILPDDTNLNTRIVVKFEVIGGKNDEFRPYELEFERLILVDSQRKFTVVTNSVAIGPYDHDEMPDIWINLTSLSSYDENMAITANIPEGWQAMCGGILLNQSGYQFTMSAGVSETVEINTICNVNRVSGVQDGIATFTVSSLDGEISWTNSQSLAFNEAPVESAGFSVMELGIGAGIVLVAFVLAILAVNMNKKKKSSMEEIKPVESLSAASQIEASSIVQTAESAGPIASEPVAQVPAGPPLPEGGLPEGWTMQQWQYYGQQYLDGTL